MLWSCALTQPGFICHSNVADIFDVLNVTVYDEDKGGKREFLGAVAIPLLEASISTFSLLSHIYSGMEPVRVAL